VIEKMQAGGNYAEDMPSEMHAAMVSISASAHALDALYGALRPMAATQALCSNASRHDHIRAALHNAFRVNKTRGKQWTKECTWLFGLRDAAVYPEEVFKEPAQHPVAGNTSPAAVHYSAEGARRAVVLMAPARGGRRGR
jgi:hypothetical protein